MRAFDGPLAGCPVWLVTNGDSCATLTDPNATTDAHGFFELPAHMLQALPSSSARVVLQPDAGCVDTHTAQRPRLSLSAPLASAPLNAAAASAQLVVSPLVQLATALMDYTAEQGLDYTASQAWTTLASYLQLPVAVDLFSYDPYAVIEGGEDDGNVASLLMATVQVGALVTQLATLENATQPSGSAACGGGLDGAAAYRRVAMYLGASGLEGLLAATASHASLLLGASGLSVGAQFSARVAMLRSSRLIGDAFFASSGSGAGRRLQASSRSAAELQRMQHAAAAAAHVANGYVISWLDDLGSGGSLADFDAAVSMSSLRTQQQVSTSSIALQLPTYAAVEPPMAPPEQAASPSPRPGMPPAPPRSPEEETATAVRWLVPMLVLLVLLAACGWVCIYSDQSTLKLHLRLATTHSNPAFSFRYLPEVARVAHRENIAEIQQMTRRDREDSRARSRSVSRAVGV